MPMFSTALSSLSYSAVSNYPRIHGFSCQNLSLMISTCSTTTLAFCFLFLSFSNCVFDNGFFFSSDDLPNACSGVDSVADGLSSYC